MPTRLLFFAAFSLLGLTSQAHAYIDPGTGSVVTTAILGFFAAIAFTARKYLYRIKDLFSGKPGARGAAKRER